MTETSRTTPPALGLAPEAAVPQAEKKGFWKKLKSGLLMTHTELIERIGAAVEGRGVVDAVMLEYLEEALLAADLGVATSMALIERLRQRVRPDEVQDAARLRALLAEEAAALLAEVPRPPAETSGRRITLMVGVNGVGKTTSIAKLARRAQLDGRNVLLAAGDTFRAAAIEQLVTWGGRLGIEVVRQQQGSDPAAIVFDALAAARSRGADELIIDTAGRLHTKNHLMAELAKINRVIDREGAGWARRTILVLDATTGQNAVIQAREFTKVVPVDGVLLAKIDGTAKGGMVVAVARELKLPVLYLGVGEGAEDLVDFRPREFAEALLG
jgi:fused signal recognition particle receptor